MSEARGHRCGASLPLLLLLKMLLLTATALPAARAHTYHAGSCPEVPPMPGFDMQRFLGKWHVLQKTSAQVRCLTNEYSAGPGDGFTLLQRMMLPVPAINNGLRYTGALSVPDRERPAAMSVRFPLNIFGSASYVVFDTDYDTYAGIYSCQKVALWYRHSASIMARGMSLDTAMLRKLQLQLTDRRINVNDMDTIRQMCGENEDGIQVHIRPNVFKPNATDILEDASGVVSSAADAAKRAFDVYNTVNTIYTGVSSLRRRRESPPPRSDSGAPQQSSRGRGVDYARPDDDYITKFLAGWMP